MTQAHVSAQLHIAARRGERSGMLSSYASSILPLFQSETHFVRAGRAKIITLPQ